MTPKINKASDRLALAYASGNPKRLHAAIIGMRVALEAAATTHRAVKIADLNAAVDELEKEAQDWDDKVTEYRGDGMHADAAMCAKDARRLRRVAKRLAA